MSPTTKKTTTAQAVALPKKNPAKRLSQSPKSDQRRDQIVRVATEIINAKSYAQATVVEIAAALELRDATLYHYFPDKVSLAFACHEQSLARFEKLLIATDEAGGTGAHKLRQFVRSMLRDSQNNGPLLYFGDFSYLLAPQREILADWGTRLRKHLAKFIREGMSDDSIVQCEPELVVQLVLGMLIWLGRWVPSVDGMTADRLMSAIDAVTFRGLEK